MSKTVDELREQIGLLERVAEAASSIFYKKDRPGTLLVSEFEFNKMLRALVEAGIKPGILQREIQKNLDRPRPNDHKEIAT